MDETLDRFAEWCLSKGYTKRGSENFIRSAKALLDWLSEKGLNYMTMTEPQADIYREHLSLLISDQNKPKYSSATINGFLAYLKRFYDFLLSVDKAMTNPFKGIERLRESFKLPKNILSKDQINKLLKNIPLRTKSDFKFKLLIELLYSTGARISEIEGLTFADINHPEHTITIKDNKEKHERTIPLTQVAFKLLHLYIEYLKSATNKDNIMDNPLLFPHGKKRTLNRWINDRLKKLCKDIGLAQITCHTFRHTLASHLFQAGADIREVQTFLGHHNIKSTEVYIHLSTDDLRQIINDYHPLEKLC